MSHIDATIKTLKKIKGNKFSGELFDNALTSLQEVENGLTDKQIESLLNLLTSDSFLNCQATSFRKLLFCCVPDSSLNSDITDIAVLWMLYKFNDGSVTPMKTNAVLEWIAGLLEFNLIERDSVDGYYELYYQLLQKDQCQRDACKLIHMLTRPEDVYRGRVESVYRLFLKGGSKAKHLSHLIELFKTFKPEFVPENVRSFGREAAFKPLSPGFLRSLEAASNRIQSRVEQDSNKIRAFSWTAVTRGRKKNKSSGVPLIPSAMYVHLGSDLYQNKRCKVIEFLDKVSLASYHLSCEIPTSILSLLLNEGGIHFLATHNSDIHARFSSVLYSCLYSVFILDNEMVSYEERNHFLEQLVVLEDYMQQGIPVVSRFLASFIASWNGHSHQKLIYRLLERITLANFAEFNDCIVAHLQTLFLSGDITEKVTILNTLSELTFNVCSYQSTSLSKEHLFLGGRCDWETDNVAILPALVRLLTEFCERGLLITCNDSQILLATLSFFETLVDYQLKLKLEITVIPPSLFYRALFSSDLSSFARACSLLLRYKNTNGSPDLNGAYGIDDVTLLNKYSCDVWNCFANKKAFSKASQGLVLQKHDKLKQIPLASSDDVFSLEYHPAILGLGMLMQNHLDTTDALFSFETLTDALKLSFGELGQCLQALETKYSEYHNCHT